MADRVAAGGGAPTKVHRGGAVRYPQRGGRRRAERVLRQC